jgi:hypothetical protein
MSIGRSITRVKHIYTEMVHHHSFNIHVIYVMEFLKCDGIVVPNQILSDEALIKALAMILFGHIDGVFNCRVNQCFYDIV